MYIQQYGTQRHTARRQGNVLSSLRRTCSASDVQATARTVASGNTPAPFIQRCNPLPPPHTGKTKATFPPNGNHPKAGPPPIRRRQRILPVHRPAPRPASATRSEHRPRPSRHKGIPPECPSDTRILMARPSFRADTASCAQKRQPAFTGGLLIRYASGRQFFRRAMIWSATFLPDRSIPPNIGPMRGVPDTAEAAMPQT